MRYSISIARFWYPLFWLLGFGRSRSFVELTGETLRVRFGTADELLQLTEIAGVGPRAWPIYYGLGAKYGPDDGVAYVGSRVGVLKIDFVQPRPLEIWGTFRRQRAHCMIISLDQAAEFMADLRGHLAAMR